MQKLMILVCLLIGSVVQANTTVKEVVKVFDGHRVDCSEDEGRYRNRAGAYRFKVTNIQAIKKEDQKEYLQVFGQIRYFRCDYVQMKEGRVGYLKAQNMDDPYVYKNLGLDGVDRLITMVGEEASLMTFRDGEFKNFGKVQLKLNQSQTFHVEISAEELGMDLSEKGEPFYDSSLDFSLNVKFNYHVDGEETTTRIIPFGKFRAHFEVEKFQVSSDIQQRWKFTIL